MPIRRPTIVTGPNDSGKSTLLRCVGFLLGKIDLSVLDLRGVAATEPRKAVVEGSFSLSAGEAAATSFPGHVAMRRIYLEGNAARWEVKQVVPVEPRFREVPSKSIKDLRQIVTDLGLSTSGSRSLKATFVEAIEAHAALQPTTEEWSSAPRQLVELLPTFVLFESARESDPDLEVQRVLVAAFAAFTKEHSFASRLVTMEIEANESLASAADKLREHILRRTRLDDLRIDPHISLKPSFSDVVLSARKEDGEGTYPLRAAGAGRRREVSLAVWEWASEVLEDLAEGTTSVSGNDLVLAYDEPDTHLDFARQSQLISILRRQARSESVRMLVATHSPMLVDRVPVRDVVLFALKDDATELHDLGAQDEDIESYLLEIAEQLGVRNSTLLHERVFVFVEGDTEVRALPILFKAVTGLLPQELGLAIVPCEGNDGALKFGSMLAGRGRAVHVILDSDTKTSNSTRKNLRPEKLAENGFVDGVNLHYVGTAELEDCFSDDLWASTANAYWPRENGVAWRSKDFGAHRAAKFSSGVLAMLGPESISAPTGKPEMLSYVVKLATNADLSACGLWELIERLARLALPSSEDVQAGASPAPEEQVNRLSDLESA